MASHYCLSWYGTVYPFGRFCKWTRDFNCCHPTFFLLRALFLQHSRNAVVESIYGEADAENNWEVSIPSVRLAMYYSLFYRRRTIVINTPIERSWAQNVNRSWNFTMEAELSELEQVIVCDIFCVSIDFSSRKFLSIARQSHTVLRRKDRSKMRRSEPRI